MATETVTNTVMARMATGDRGKKSANDLSSLTVYAKFQDFLNQQQGAETGSSKTAAQTDAQAQTASQTTNCSTQEYRHVVQPGETIWELAREQYHLDPTTLLQYNKITNAKNLRAGQEIRIPADGSTACTATDTSIQVVAGWYGARHQGKSMANGQPFDMNAATIAHRNLPIGTQVELENPTNGNKVQATVTDRGPYHRNRDVDLSYGLAKKLSLIDQGVGTLKMRVL